MLTMGERNQWRPGLRPGHADDYAVVATYAQLSVTYRDKRMLAPSRALFDFLLTRKFDEPLVWGNASRRASWRGATRSSWGRRRSPPSARQPATARYLDLANRLWWKTTDYLYDNDEHLYYRDSRYFGQREPNGRKVFWSRGNGWVLAGLARVLQDMPADYPDRPRYLALFRDMAAKVASRAGR